MNSSILPIYLLNLNLTINALTLFLLLTLFVLTIVSFRFNSLFLRGFRSNSTTLGLTPPPGPKAWPVFGSLGLLARFPTPWDAFASLKSVYGNIFKITLGSTDCVVVSSLDLIRKVLSHRDHSFCGRPNFLRYHALFGGDRDRSLALCDWSKIQRIRRKLAFPYVFPRHNTNNANQLESVIESELSDYVETIFQKCEDNRNNGSAKEEGSLFSKQYFSLVCANIFFRYFCSKSYSYNDAYFQQMVRRFDDIFHNINDGFALDFLPWLFPFYFWHLSKLYYCGQFIRRFLINTLLSGRSKTIDPNNPKDFLDAILLNSTNGTANSKDACLTNEYALYQLEDILGGHSAVSSFWSRIIAQIAHRPDIQEKIQQEIDYVTSTEARDNIIRLCHRPSMPYTQAVILETLRVTTSPIIPHVAMEDSNIGSFHIKKNTVVFLNNHYLNTSAEYWKDPQIFDPSRFLNDDGHVVKPDHFLPFGSGKRSCLGYQLVQNITFLATVKLLQNFNIVSLDETASGESNLQQAHRFSKKVEIAKLAVRDDDFKAAFVCRLKSKATLDIMTLSSPPSL